MTRNEAARINHQEAALLSLGFTVDEAAKLRRISLTLHRWNEYECGTGDGQVTRSIERDGDAGDGKPFMRIQYPTAHGYVDRRWPIADRERGAIKRLNAIIEARNARAINGEKTVCPNCDQWQHAGNHGDCLNECRKRGFAPKLQVAPYVQGDPRGAALYILRPGDVPEGQDAGSYYSRGICVY